MKTLESINKKTLAIVALVALVLVSLTGVLRAVGIINLTSPLTTQDAYNANIMLEFQTGTFTSYSTNLGLCTNTFQTPFSATPTIIVQPSTGYVAMFPTNVWGTAGTNYAMTNFFTVILSNPTNFVFQSGQYTNQATFNYIAIGAP